MKLVPGGFHARLLTLSGVALFACATAVRGVQSPQGSEVKVEVRVDDAVTGRAVAQAEVDVTQGGHEDTRAIRVSRSMEDGWKFWAAPGSEYRVRVTALGYVDTVVTALAQTGGTILVVELNPDPVPLPDIVATTGRTGRIGTVHKIERRDMALRGRHIENWVRDLPGFQVTGRGPGGRSVVSVRGSRPEAVEVTLDGVPLTDPLTGVADLSLVSAGTLETVVATAGAGDGAGWAGSAGTIRLESRLGEPGVGAGVGVGSFGQVTTDVDVGVSAPGFEAAGSFTYGVARNDFSFDNRVRPGVPTERRVNSDYSNWGGLGRMSLTGWPVRVVARVDGIERGAPGRMGSEVWDFARWKERVSSVGASLGANGDVRGRRLSLSWSRRDQTYSDARFDTVDELHADQIVTTGEEPLPASVDLSWRLDWARVRGQAVSGPTSRVSGGIRAVKTLEISPAWVADGAVSFDVSDVGTAVSPTVGVSWRPMGGTRFWARASQGVRLPTFGDLYLRAGGGATPNPDLRPERVVFDAEVGTAFEPRSGRLRLSAATFARHTRDPIVWLPSVVAVWSPINAGQLTAYGLETSLSVMVGPGWAVETSATLQSSQLGFDGYSNPLSYQPALSGRVAVERSGAGRGVRVDLEIEGARRTSIYGPHELPAFALLDIRASQRIRGLGLDGVLEVGLLNVFDVAYERVELFPEPGRSIEMRLNVRPGGTTGLQSKLVGRSLVAPQRN